LPQYELSFPHDALLQRLVLSPRDELSRGIHHDELFVPNHRDELLPVILHGELSLVTLHDEQL
jgi:hypothetical protein